GGLVRTGQFEVDDLEALGPVERAEDMTERVGHEAVPDARRALLRHLDPRDLGIGLAECGHEHTRIQRPGPGEALPLLDLPGPGAPRGGAHCQPGAAAAALRAAPG